MLRPYRRATQMGVVALVFLIPLLNLHEIYAVTGTFYAMSFGGLGVADPSAILQAIFAAGELTVPLLGAALLPVLLCLVFGRIWCGWLCPYHFFADGAAGFRSIILQRVLKRPPAGSPRFCPSIQANSSRFGFLLVGTALAGMVGIPLLNYFNAPAVISTEAMILVKERIVSVELVFIAALFILELTVLPRFWCRLFCPTGTVISVLRLPFTLRVATTTRPAKRPCCTENHCSGACPMGLAPYRGEARDLLCTNCGRCVDACRSARLRFRGFQVREASLRREQSGTETGEAA